MAEWSRNKVNSSDLNNGNEFNSNDRVARQELNAMVNAGLYAQDFAEHLADTPDTSDANNVGIPTITFVDSPSATSDKPYKRLKFANLKGAQGVGVTNISSGTATTSGEMTTTPVTFTLSNNSTQTINVYAQKGEAGQNGTTINVNNIPQSSVNFDSDPQAQIDAKVDKIDGKQLSTNDYTTEEKTKLSGIEVGAEVNNPIDSTLSTTSENAVQNKVVTEALNNKTTVNISNVAQDSINFTSDPQTQIDNITGDISTLQNQIDDINDNSWTLFLHQPLSTVSGVSSVNITNVFDFYDYDYKIEYLWTPDKWADVSVRLKFLNSLNNIITFPFNSWIRTTLDMNYNSGQEGSFTPSGYAKCGNNETIVDWGLNSKAGKGPFVYNGEFIAGYDCDGNRVINYNTLSSRASFWCQQQYQYSGTLDISDSLIEDGITGLNLFSNENVNLLANKSYIKLYRRKGGWNNNF